MLEVRFPDEAFVVIQEDTVPAPFFQGNDL